jgi:hypothetical protein
MRPHFFSKNRIFWIYLFLLGLIGILLARYATATYGAGVGTDGAIQIATADHLIAGEGFYDYTEKPFVRWPPLYPLALAAIGWLTGMDTFVVGWNLNVLLFGVIIWLGGALLYSSFEHDLLWAFLGSLVITTSVSLLGLSAHIGTDPLFIAIGLAYILIARRYLETKGYGALISLALLACLGSLQRLPGVIMIAMIPILVIIAQRENILRGFREGLLFSALPLLPLSYWILVHNYLHNKTLFGVIAFEATMPLRNLVDSLEKIWHWFVPYSVSARIPPLLLVGLPGVMIIVASRQKDWRGFYRRLLAPPVAASLIFASLYFLFLTFSANSVDTSYAYYDRYQVVILVPILILIFTTLQEMILPRLKKGQFLARSLVLAAFIVWLAYPIFSVYKYVRLSRIEGVQPYNIYNTRRMRESKIIFRLSQISSDYSRDIYSNYPAAAWFYTRRSVLESPRGSIIEKLDVDRVIQDYRGWPGNKPAYLVWFLPNEYGHVLEPEDLKGLASLNLIYQGRDGELYRVRSR